MRAEEQFGLRSSDDILTDREREVATLATEGLSNKEIARALRLTEGTVKQYLHSAFTKLGIQRRILLHDHLRPAQQSNKEPRSEAGGKRAFNQFTPSGRQLTATIGRQLKRPMVG